MAEVSTYSVERINYLKGRKCQPGPAMYPVYYFTALTGNIISPFVDHIRVQTSILMGCWRRIWLGWVSYGLFPT